MDKRMIVLGMVLITLMISFPASRVSAHPPANVSLDYNFSTQVLTVSVSHSVSNVNTHYIEQIVIEKNSVQVDSRDYTSQDSTASMSDTFNINATHGDILKATAICSISGSGFDEITVIDPASSTTTTSTTQDFPMTLVIGLGVVILGVVSVIILIIKRR
jgi:hypothetical protein